MSTTYRGDARVAASDEFVDPVIVAEREFTTARKPACAASPKRSRNGTSSKRNDRLAAKRGIVGLPSNGMHSQLQLCLRLCAANTSRCNSPRCTGKHAPVSQHARRRSSRDAFDVRRSRWASIFGKCGKTATAADPVHRLRQRDARCGQDGGYPVRRSVIVREKPPLACCFRVGFVVACCGANKTCAAPTELLSLGVENAGRHNI